MKNLSVVLIAGVICFASCSFDANCEKNNENIDVSNSIEEHMVTDNTSSTIDNIDPPLSNDELLMAVPDFLSADQQMLYRKASNVYSHLFGCSTDSVEYRETLDYNIGEYEHFGNETGGVYCISQGRYCNWNDFEKLVLSVFTEDFFITKNRMRFIEHEGKLAFVDAARGGAEFYNHNFEDDFELISKSDDEIIFYVIGHYSQMRPLKGESFEERDVRVATRWEVTDKFTIRMLKTESGWRFDQFYDASIDERTELLVGLIIH